MRLLRRGRQHAQETRKQYVHSLAYSHRLRPLSRMSFLRSIATTEFHLLPEFLAIPRNGMHIAYRQRAQFVDCCLTWVAAAQG